MLKRTTFRAALVCAAATTLILGTADTAMADDTLVLEGRGRMVFYDDGDDFAICDTNGDGHGVTGSLLRWTWHDPTGTWYWDTVASQQDGGDSGCDPMHYNIREGVDYRMKLCWNGASNNCASTGLKE